MKKIIVSVITVVFMTGLLFNACSKKEQPTPVEEQKPETGYSAKLRVSKDGDEISVSSPQNVSVGFLKIGLKTAGYVSGFKLISSASYVSKLNITPAEYYASAAGCECIASAQEFADKLSKGQSNAASELKNLLKCILDNDGCIGLSGYDKSALKAAYDYLDRGGEIEYTSGNNSSNSDSNGSFSFRGVDYTASSKYSKCETKTSSGSTVTTYTLYTSDQNSYVVIYVYSNSTSVMVYADGKSYNSSYVTSKKPSISVNGNSVAVSADVASSSSSTAYTVTASFSCK